MPVESQPVSYPRERSRIQTIWHPVFDLPDLNRQSWKTVPWMPKMVLMVNSEPKAHLMGELENLDLQLLEEMEETEDRCC